MFSGRRRGNGLALFMLIAQVFQMGGFASIPVGTLGLVALNSFVFLKPFSLPWHVRQATVSVYDVWHLGQWKRLFLAPFFHVDEWHLYYNMASFLWKGKSLEPAMGTAKFLVLNAAFVGLTSSLLVALTAFWAFLNPMQTFQILHQSAIGYSGVIFALKVVTTHRMPAGSSISIMGMFPVPVKLAVWAELGIASLLTPNASFLGHLAGILVGLAYVHCGGEGVLNSVFGEFPSWRSRRRTRQAATRRAEDRHDDDYDADYHAAMAASLSQVDLDAQQQARGAALARQSQARPLEALRNGPRLRRTSQPSTRTATGTTQINRSSANSGGDVGTVNPPDFASSAHLQQQPYDDAIDDGDLQTATAASVSDDSPAERGFPQGLESDAAVQAAILRSLEEDRNASAGTHLYPDLGEESRVNPSAPPLNSADSDDLNVPATANGPAGNPHDQARLARLRRFAR